VEESGSRPDLLTSILNTDEGARGVGEFAIGVNPYILHPMKDTLFDEKIAGSFHFTPGNCYDDCPNGNHSAIHWDLVNIQRPEYGGGRCGLTRNWCAATAVCARRTALPEPRSSQGGSINDL
jgi:aminopeptidase